MIEAAVQAGLFKNRREGKAQSLFALARSLPRKAVQDGRSTAAVLRTTPEQDKEALDLIESQRGNDNSRCYSPVNTCRTYSQDKFEMFQKRFGVEPSQPPDRPVAPRDPRASTGSQ